MGYGIERFLVVGEGEDDDKDDDSEGEQEAEADEEEGGFGGFRRIGTHIFILA